MFVRRTHRLLSDPFPECRRTSHHLLGVLDLQSSYLGVGQRRMSGPSVIPQRAVPSSRRASVGGSEGRRARPSTDMQPFVRMRRQSGDGDDAEDEMELDVTPDVSAGNRRRVLPVGRRVIGSPRALE